MTDDSQLPEAELAALADGSLRADRREHLQARIDTSPELAAALAEQEQAVTMLRALDQPAPATLRASVEAMTQRDAGRSARRAPRWRRTLFMPAATALAIVVAALVVVLGGASAPTVPQTARLSLAAATMPAPPEDLAHPGLLRLRVDGLAFPYYGRTSGWEATGARTDRLDGRRVLTVFYTVGGANRVGYSIVSGSPLTVSGGTTAEHGGVRYTTQHVGDGRLVTWQRNGHTCVIAGGRRQRPDAAGAGRDRGTGSS